MLQIVDGGAVEFVSGGVIGGVFVLGDVVLYGVLVV